MVKLKAIEQRLLASPDHQVSLTDPDARSMKSRDGGIVGYNVQCAVDAQNHMIVAHEVVTQGIDRDLLTTMAEQAREAMGQEDLTAVADRGYYKGEEILKCEQAGIAAIVPKSLTSNNRAHGLFDKQDFIYVVADDEYRCPANQRAIWRFTTVERGINLRRYWSSACPRRPHQSTMHKQRVPADYSLGTRAGSGRDAGAARSTSRNDANTSTNSRASFWHDQTLDGLDSFLDEETPQRQDRNEFACTGLQLKTRDADLRNTGTSKGSTSLSDSRRFFDSR